MPRRPWRPTHPQDPWREEVSVRPQVSPTGATARTDRAQDTDQIGEEAGGGEAADRRQHRWTVWVWGGELRRGILLLFGRVSVPIVKAMLLANKCHRWCGKGIYYCSAPDCQINYGSGCDGVCALQLLSPRAWLTSPQNQKPWGLDTSQVARPKVGNVLYGGAGVYNCKKVGDIALTFDDGPYKYTNDLLDKLRVSGCHKSKP